MSPNLFCFNIVYLIYTALPVIDNNPELSVVNLNWLPFGAVRIKAVKEPDKPDTLALELISPVAFMPLEAVY